MGGGFSPQFWLLDGEGSMIGANHPANHADNEIIFTVAALHGPETSKRKLLHTLMAKIYAVYPAAELHIHAGCQFLDKSSYLKDSCVLLLI